MAEKSIAQILLEHGKLKSFRHLFEFDITYTGKVFARQSGMKYTLLLALDEDPGKITVKELYLVATTLRVDPVALFMLVSRSTGLME